MILGTTSVKTSVLKDGHLFMVHVVDPKVKGQDDEEEEETEEVKKDEGVENSEGEKAEKEGSRYFIKKFM